MNVFAGPRDYELHIPAAMRGLRREAAWVGLEFLAVAAAGDSIKSVPIGADAHLLILGASASTSATGAGAVDSSASPARVKAELRVAGDRSLGMVRLSHLAEVGSAGPMLWQVPVLIQAATTASVAVHNSEAAVRDVWITFHCLKLWVR